MPNEGLSGGDDTIYASERKGMLPVLDHAHSGIGKTVQIRPDLTHVKAQWGIQWHSVLQIDKMTEEVKC